MQTCIATITMGDNSRRMWEDVFAPSWRDYAHRHGYVIEQFTEPFDPSDTRHPSWQKLLIPEQERLSKYDKILWLDHDVLISPTAPALEEVPAGKIGAVTWKGSYQNDPVMRAAFQRTWDANNAPWVREANLKCFADLLQLAGYPPAEDHLNCGVLVFEPSHAKFCRFIYENEPETPRSSMEQSAVTHWLCGNRPEVCHPMDCRFNRIWDFERVAYYPFLGNLYPTSTIIMHAISATLQRCFFLHFAGGGERQEARNYVNQAHLRERKEAA